MGRDREAVEGVVAAFVESWNRHDMEAFADLFVEDADFVNVIGLWWKGRPEIRAAHEAAHATMFENSRLGTFGTAVRFLKPDVAVARTNWELTGHTGPRGEALPPRNGILTNVMIREDDRWLIVATQNTDIVAAG